MKKKLIFGTIIIALIAVLVWLGKKNSKSPIEYETGKAFKTNIVRKTVATGKVIPLEEVEIKPQITGIIEKIFVIEGAKLKKGGASGADGNTPDIYHMLPFSVLLLVHRLFVRRASFQKDVGSPFWLILEFIGLPKAKVLAGFDDFRWICKSPVLQMWYLRALQPRYLLMSILMAFDLRPRPQMLLA